MIVDSSAVVAILLNEPAAAICLEALLGSTTLRLSAATFLEAAIVVDRLPNPRHRIAFNQLLGGLGIIIEPVTVQQARLARDAHQRFGRGTGHPAKLNFGDCLSYALEKELDEPLLFVGNDFVYTDIRPALP